MAIQPWPFGLPEKLMSPIARSWGPPPQPGTTQVASLGGGPVGNVPNPATIAPEQAVVAPVAQPPALKTGLPEPGGIARSDGSFLQPVPPSADEAFRRPYDTPTPPPVDPERMDRPGVRVGTEVEGPPIPSGTGGLYGPDPNKTGGLYDPNAKPAGDPWWKKILADKGLGEAAGKAVGALGGGGGSGMQMSAISPMGGDPTAASRQGAAELFKQLLEGNFKSPGYKPGGFKPPDFGVR